MIKEYEMKIIEKNSSGNETTLISIYEEKINRLQEELQGLKNDRFDYEKLKKENEKLKKEYEELMIDFQIVCNSKGLI